MFLQVVRVCFLVGIVCAADDVNSFLRLSDGPSSTEGRVEVFLNGSWGSVCDQLWDMQDANVACKQLGCRGALEASRGSQYGPGILDVKLTNVDCGADGDNLMDCPHTIITPEMNTTCNSSTEAGVKCNCGVTVTIGEGNSGSGVIKVTPAGETEGTLCYDSITLPTADVACREAGFLAATSTSPSGATADTLLNVYYSCDGKEISLGACTESPFNTSLCTDGENAAVLCKTRDEPTAEPTVEAPPQGLSTGAIVGIVIAVLLGTMLIVGIAFCVCKAQRRGPASI